MTEVGYGEVLKMYRLRTGQSQSGLAQAAGFDHSYVSRLESGARTPTREAVLRISAHLAVKEGDTDRMLAAAGFLPRDMEEVFARRPTLMRAMEFLDDPTVPVEVRNRVAELIDSAVRMCLVALDPTSPR